MVNVVSRMALIPITMLTTAVYSCSPSAAGAGTCWPSTPGSLLCVDNPWDKRLHRVTFGGQLAPVQPTAIPEPFAMLLDDGTRCLQRNGGAWGGRDDGYVGTYLCGDPSANLAVLWLPSRGPGTCIDRSTPAWTVQIGQLGTPTTHFPPPQPHAVTTGVVRRRQGRSVERVWADAITQRMSGPGHSITHVSDTARWTALHRATESARPDALFSDPLAERLAGEHGRAIVANVPRSTRNGWWLVARTKIIDDAIAAAISEGCDRVLNLAAGLDTRPYRLKLPSEFTWVEADLPKLLEEKTQLLADHAPRCRLTRVAVDLADPMARDAFLDDALNGATKALVLTEGLLMYLDDSDVVALSAAIKRPEVAWWMLDFAGPGLKKMMNKKMAGMLQNAPFKFAPENGLACFEDLGWHTVDVESLFEAAHRFHRLPMLMRPVAWLPQPDPRHPGSSRPWSAVALLAP